MQECPKHATELPAFYQAKRDYFCTLLQDSRFRFSPSNGTYFQLANYSAISKGDMAFVTELTQEKGVAAIPLAPFYREVSIPESSVSASARMTAHWSAPPRSSAHSKAMSEPNYKQLTKSIRAWGHELGFAQLAITDVDLGDYHDSYRQWLNEDCHGDMAYMADNVDKRLYPERLHEETCRISTVRMDYAKVADNSLAPLSKRNTAYIARYARGRDTIKSCENACRSWPIKSSQKSASSAIVRLSTAHRFWNGHWQRNPG